MSDGMGRELAYLSSHATNRYFIPNWGKNIQSKSSTRPTHINKILGFSLILFTICNIGVLLIILIETFLCAERAKCERAVRECCQLISYINIEV